MNLFRRIYFGSLWSWNGFGLTITSTILFAIAFATNGWSITKSDAGHTAEIGLWQYCLSYGKSLECKAACERGRCSDAFWHISRAFAILTLMALIVATSMAIAYLFLHKFRRDRRVVTGWTITSFIAFTFMMTCVAAYGTGWLSRLEQSSSKAHVTGELSYSFNLAIAAAAIGLAASFSALVELFCLGRRAPDRQYGPSIRQSLVT